MTEPAHITENRVATENRTEANALRLQLSLIRAHFALSVDLTLPAHGITAITGRSGCGKTTLLRCIAGLEKAQGSVHFQQQCWQDARSFLPTYQRPLAYVFQEPGLFPHLNSEGNLLFAYRHVPAAQRQLHPEQIIALLHLAPLLKQRPNQLSGGQRQRVALGRALLANPQLLLLDEPLSNLDQQSRHELLQCLEQLHVQLNLPMLYVSHAQDEITRLADHLLLMENGSVRAHGPLHSLLTDPALPLAMSDDACAVLQGHVVQHDEHYQQSLIAVGHDRLWISRCPQAPGSTIRLRIQARDVSVALSPLIQSSISNHLQVTLLDMIADHDPSRLLLRLQCQNQPLLARITRRSADELALQPGLNLYAQIKAVATLA